MTRFKKFLADILKQFNMWNYKNGSYSQEGEDLILNRYFEYQKDGFYIDVGAHHPFRFSNTYLFYKKGWRGINIDAMPGSMKLFNRFRKRDINIECGISNKSGFLKYYEFDEPALNGFDKKVSCDRNKNTNYKIEKITKIKVKTLNEILNKYKFLLKKRIDFITIDVEGFDFYVLESINLIRYSPKLVLVENIENDVLINNYLGKFGYKFYAKTVNTYFYEKK